MSSPVPAQPALFHRLDEIFTALRAMTSAHLDRQAVEKLFGVGQRRARQLMAGLDGIRAGNAAAVSRLALIERGLSIAGPAPRVMFAAAAS